MVYVQWAGYSNGHETLLLKAPRNIAVLKKSVPLHPISPYKSGPYPPDRSRPLSPRTILQAHLVPFTIFGDYPDQRFSSKFSRGRN